MNWKVLLVRAASTRRSEYEKDAEGEEGLGQE